MGAILKMIMAFMMSFLQFMAPINNFIDAGGEASYFTKWNLKTEFTESAYTVIEKDPTKDFVILNLADVQLNDDEVFADMGTRANNMIASLIEKTQPDLITLTGDNAWGTVAYMELINYIDSFGIPWAPVMGNHDGQGCVSEFWAAELFTQAENCLFQFGPENMGYGNYILNVTENGEIIHTLFMMDTHANRDYTLEDGTVLENEYDHLWPLQMNWYKWAVNGIAQQEGKVVESTCFMHIPVIQYRYAWDDAWDEEAQSFRPEYAENAFGKNSEWVCSAPVDNGFFDLCKELGSTKNMIVGHDHVNSSSIVYEGIRLTYGLKLGEGCYFEDGMTGGTTLTINSQGNVTTEHHYMALS